MLLFSSNYDVSKIRRVCDAKETKWWWLLVCLCTMGVYYIYICIIHCSRPAECQCVLTFDIWNSIGHLQCEDQHSTSVYCCPNKMIWYMTFETTLDIYSVWCSWGVRPAQYQLGSLLCNVSMRKMHSVMSRTQLSLCLNLTVALVVISVLILQLKRQHMTTEWKEVCCSCVHSSVWDERVVDSVVYCTGCTTSYGSCVVLMLSDGMQWDH